MKVDLENLLKAQYKMSGTTNLAGHSVGRMGYGLMQRECPSCCSLHMRVEQGSHDRSDLDPQPPSSGDLVRGYEVSTPNLDWIIMRSSHSRRAAADAGCTAWSTATFYGPEDNKMANVKLIAAFFQKVRLSIHPSIYPSKLGGKRLTRA